MTGILGRAAEIAAIEDFLEGRTDGARVLVLEGEPGIGKTTLWRWAAANSERHGVTVLHAQPTEAEQELAFATLGDILGGFTTRSELSPNRSGGRCGSRYYSKNRTAACSTSALSELHWRTYYARSQAINSLSLRSTIFNGRIAPRGPASASPYEGSMSKWQLS